MQDWLTYRLSDFLMFSSQTYYRMLERYHEAVWPMHVVVLAIVIAVFMLLRPSDAWAGVVISVLLAAGWLWVGVAFHLQRYAQINWAAKYFAGMFVVQAALLVWCGSVKRSLTFPGLDDETGRLGPAVLVVALVLPPLAVLAQGRGWSQVDLAWLTPDATAMLTLALLLGATPRAPRILLVLPILWCVIAAATLIALESPEASVPVVAVIASMVAIRRARLTKTAHVSS